MHANRASLILLLLSVAARPAAGQAAATDVDPRSLPVRRVVLYKAGIGYFEHVGRVQAGSEVVVDFTSGQLNDVLKSLTALDLDGGRVTGIRYNSVAPLGDRLRTLRLPLDEQTTVVQVLNALRGARVEVRAGAVPGRGTAP
ncbi:MAG: hypothetical protein HYX76_13145 [Acidobacteria bacterium]|nr:hypothetical protein [Acidobacteriota bacterium]